VLGLSPRQKIDRELSNERYIVIPEIGPESAAKKSRPYLKVPRVFRELKIRASTLDHEDKKDADFIPLDAAITRQPERRGSGEEDSASDEETSYRSVAGKARPSAHPEDQDLEYLPDTDTKPSAEEEALTSSRELEATLSQRTKLDPSNAQAWLDLINHQDLYYPRNPLNHTSAEKASLAELKLSIAEKALRHVQAGCHLDLLLLVRMEQGGVLWDTPKVMKKWSELLSKHSKYANLWIAYIDYVQCNFSVFQAEELRDIYGKTLGALELVRSGSKLDEEDLHQAQCYILLRLTLFLMKAGYTELAIGIWQANLEFNFFRPDTSHGSLIQLKALFEVYWDSEAPRIGEDQPLHWSHYTAKNGNAPDSKQDRQLPQLESPGEWYSLEQLAEANHLPARTLDDVTENDPYRVILYSDIEPFIISAPQMGDGMLLEAFSAFCGLPSPKPVSSVTHWWWDSFLRNDLIVGDIQTSTMSDKQKTGILHLDRFLLTPEIMFDKEESLPQPFSRRNVLHSDGLFVRQALLELVNHDIGSDALAEYYLAYENVNFPGTARKAAKRLLKQHSSSLRLYNSYALIEWRSGNRAAAARVWATAINMSPMEPGTSHLWVSWVLKLLEDEGKEAALSRIITMSDSQIQALQENQGANDLATNVTAIVRVRQILINARDHSMALIDYDSYVRYCVLLALLACLSTTDALAACITSIEDGIATLSSSLPRHSVHHELLHQYQARIIEIQVRHDPSYSPKIVRAAVEKGITQFPQNTVLQSLFAFLEARFRMDDRLRIAVSSLTRNVKEQTASTSSNPQALETVITHVFAIKAEMVRAATMGANQNSIRAAFEHSVQSVSGSRSVLIWTMFVLWEHDQGSMKHARNTWWRAVRACPWAKSLWVLAWDVDGLVEKHELQGVLETMRDKEIRIRVPLDD
jgi:hypothetical protein